MKKDLTIGTPWKQILLFALPIMAGNLLQQLYNTADTMIVGRFDSEQALTAVGACSSLTLLFLTLATGLSVGVGVLIAQYFGAKRYETLRTYASTAIILMVVLGAAISLTAFSSAQFLLESALDTPAEYLSLSVCYLRIYAVGLIFQFGYNVVAAILRAIGDSKATLLFLTISSVINIILDLLFVAGFGMGVAGAAIATVLSQVCSCVAAFAYMHRIHELLRFRVRELHFETSAAADIVRVSTPMALQQIMVSSGFVFLQKLVNFYGGSMMAAYTVSTRVESMVQIPIIGVQSTLSTYAAQNMGAGKPERVSKGLGQSILLCLAMAGMLVAVLFTCTPQIVSAFGIDASSADLCVRELRVVCVGTLLFAIYFPANGVFQGVGEGFFSMFCAVLTLGFRVFFAYTLHETDLFSYTAIWWSQSMALIVTLLVCYTHYFRGSWKKKTLIRQTG